MEICEVLFFVSVWERGSEEGLFDSEVLTNGFLFVLIKNKGKNL